MSLRSSLRFILAHPLNRDRKMRALARVLGWQLRMRSTEDSALVPWVNGTRLSVRHGETGLTGNVYCGLHEFADMGFLLHFLREDDLFVDVGANLGSYTVLACGARGARGISFEPVPETYARLLDNLRVNGLDPRAVAHNWGLADREGVLRFSARHDTGNHVLAPGEKTEAVEVRVQSLDRALEGAVPALLKIDVEGFELPVLQGAQHTLDSPALQAVIMEVNGSGGRYGFGDEDLREEMTKRGFEEFVYEPLQRDLRRPTGPRPMEGNGLFVRNAEIVRARLREAPKFQILGLSI